MDVDTSRTCIPLYPLYSLDSHCNLPIQAPPSTISINTSNRKGRYPMDESLNVEPSVYRVTSNEPRYYIHTTSIYTYPGNLLYYSYLLDTILIDTREYKVLYG